METKRRNTVYIKEIVENVENNVNCLISFAIIVRFCYIIVNHCLRGVGLVRAFLGHFLK